MKKFIKTFESYDTFTQDMMADDAYYASLRNQAEKSDPSYKEPVIYQKIVDNMINYNPIVLEELKDMLEVCVNNYMDSSKFDMPDECKGLTIGDAEGLIDIIDKTLQMREDFLKDIEELSTEVKDIARY